jgi:hypothetical protein
MKSESIIFLDYDIKAVQCGVFNCIDKGGVYKTLEYFNDFMDYYKRLTFIGGTRNPRKRRKRFTINR